jgi:hypothetical protein
MNAVNTFLTIFPSLPMDHVEALIALVALCVAGLAILFALSVTRSAKK